MTDQTTTELLSNAVWVDGDPLMEAIAAAVWEHCDTSGGHSIVTDDPRNIAAVARTEHAAVSAAPLLPADQTTPLRDRIAATLRTTRRIGYEGKADHGTHRYDARCALCAGDVDALTEALAAAVLPATTNHDTDTVPAWAPCSPEWLRAMPAGACSWAPRKAGDGATVSHYHPALPAPVDRAAVLREAAEALEARRCSPESVDVVLRLIDERLCDTCKGYGQTAAPTEDGGIVRRCRECGGKGLRRVADETAATETEGARCSCGGRFPISHLHADTHQPAVGARQDGAQQ